MGKWASGTCRETCKYSRMRRVEKEIKKRERVISVLKGRIYGR